MNTATMLEDAELATSAAAANKLPAYMRAYRFLGKRVTVLIFLGILIGVSLFMVEMAFAFSLQAFLVCVHVMPAAAGGRFVSKIQNWNMPLVLGMIFVVGLVRAALNWAQIYTQSCSSLEFGHLQRSRIVRWAFHSESISTYAVMALFEGQVGAGNAFVNIVQGLAVLLTSNAMVLVSLLYISPSLSLTVLVAMLLLFWPLRLADRMIIDTSRNQALAGVRTTQKIIVSMRNLLLIQIYGTQRTEEGLCQATLSDNRLCGMRVAKIMGMKSALPQFVGMILICVITMAARDHARMSPGVLVSYFYLLIRLLAGLSGLNIMVSTAAATWSETKRLYRWWSEESHDGLIPPELVRHALVLAPRPDDAKPVGWRLQNVTFTYALSLKPVLENLNLRIAPGETLAITGPSGAGKTTLLNVLLGNYEPNGGLIDAVLPGGECRPLRPFRSELLPLIGYVGPESFMIEGSIRENLLYGLQHKPSDDEITAALEKAECDFVGKMAGGLKHMLTEQGHGLSAGQKQRLALARALLRRPKVMILDEATSNLDNETEERLVETFARLKGEMTIIATTHRQALLRIADQRLTLV